jgi:predicted phosphodiesterase
MQNKRIGIFQDVHANLPAFKKALEVFDQQGCERLYHVGDLIGIGPYPKEVLELAISTQNLTLIMGNHDYWFAFGIPDPRPSYMSMEELEHQQWVHSQIGNAYRGLVQKWRFVEELFIDEHHKISFAHYGYDANKNWFKSFVKEPNQDKMDVLFQEFDSKMIFYGHNHHPSDITGKARYVNLGSAGCHHKPEVRLGILETGFNLLDLKKLSVPYNDNGLMEAFEIKKVPARAFITKTFITRDK